MNIKNNVIVAKNNIIKLFKGLFRMRKKKNKDYKADNGQDNGLNECKEGLTVTEVRASAAKYFGDNERVSDVTPKVEAPYGGDLRLSVSDGDGLRVPNIDSTEPIAQNPGNPKNGGKNEGNIEQKGVKTDTSTLDSGSKTGIEEISTESVPNDLSTEAMETGDNEPTPGLVIRPKKIRPITDRIASYEDYLANPEDYVERDDYDKLNFGTYLNRKELVDNNYIANRVPRPGDWDYVSD